MNITEVARQLVSVINAGDYSLSCPENVDAQARAFEEVLRKSELQWTRDLPNVEGFYWRRLSGSLNPNITLVRRSESGDLFVGTGVPLIDAQVSDWAGPIQPPTKEGE